MEMAQKNAVYEKICKDALKYLKPDKEENLRNKNFSDLLLKVANQKLKQFGAKAMICGSVAKGTNLKGKNEMDLFLCFKTNIPKNKLGEFGLEIGKDIVEEFNGKVEIGYAEHPYVRGKILYEKILYSVDIVPCFETPSDKIITSVDRTPHHVRYVIRRLKRHDDVRLLKAFLKSAGCYGADVITQGFSGYLCELLIINYGSFMKLIKAATQWKSCPVDLSRGKFGQKAPLIVLDPVDEKRNVAAAVSGKSLFKFVRAARDFLVSPSVAFFLPRQKLLYSKVSMLRTARARGSRMFLLRFPRPEGIVDDVIYPQMCRTARRIKDILEENDFKAVMCESFVNTKECFIFIEFENWHVSKVRRHYGPSIYDRHAAGFLSRYKEWKIGIENEKWFVDQEREFKSAEDLLKWLISRDKEKLSELGIAPGLLDAFMKSELYYDAAFFNFLEASSDDLRAFLHGLFEEDLNIVA